MAGFGSDILGATAAVVVTPLLITFSDIDSYTAIVITLITDMFPSFSSYLTYKKNGNIHLRDGIYLTVATCVCAFMVVSSVTDIIGS